MGEDTKLEESKWGGREGLWAGQELGSVDRKFQGYSFILVELVSLGGRYFYIKTMRKIALRKIVAYDTFFFH